jgi:hypothetical protein
VFATGGDGGRGGKAPPELHSPRRSVPPADELNSEQNGCAYARSSDQLVHVGSAEHAAQHAASEAHGFTSPM